MAADTVVEVRVGRKTFRSLDAALSDIENRVRNAIEFKSAPKVSRELMEALNKVTDEMVRQHGRPWTAGKGARSGRRNLLLRSGEGLRGIVESVKVRGARRVGDIQGEIGAPFPISVHEEGARIRAKQARYLTIPLPAALTSSGTPLRRRARDWEDTFVARSRRGNLLIFQRRVDGIVPLYVLKTQVTLPPRLKLGQTLDRVGLRYFERRAFEAISRELDKL